jgi:fructokinase
MSGVLSFGEVLWDVIDGQKFLGGAPLNFAVHFVQSGGKSALLSGIGKDEDGKNALSLLNEKNVDTSTVAQHQNHATGTVTVTLKNGQPSYIIHENVAYDHIEEPEKLLSDYDLLYFGTLAQRSPQNRKTLYSILAKNKFKQVFYDVNLRPNMFTKEIIAESLKYCTILKLNDEEVIVLGKLLYDQDLDFAGFVKRVLADHAQIQLVIVTKGADGCSIYNRSGIYHIPSPEITVADTVGAGDSFSASFLYCYSAGYDLNESATIANTIAGFVASNHGPIPAYNQEIKNMLRGR